MKGSRILLNGKKVMLSGYGDDLVFPDTMLPPADKEFYLKRLRLAKSLGFNNVRFHSAVVTEECLDACDEMGMLIQPELPIAYVQYFEEAEGNPQAIETYR